MSQAMNPTLTAAAPAVESTDSAPSQVERIADAAHRCMSVTGVKATTVEAIAAAAGVARATVYRHFPGGRAEVILAAGTLELERFAELLKPELDAAATLEELLVVAVHGSVDALGTSGPIAEVLDREPELVLPHLGFDRMPEVFVIGADLLRPHLRRFLPDSRSADRLAEWVTRIVLSHHIAPSADVDLTDRDVVQAYIRRFVVPAFTIPPT